LADVRARAPRSRPVTHVATELRREQNAVASTFEHLTEQLLAASAVAVDVSGVEEGDPFAECGVDHCARLPEADATTEVVAAEPDDGYLGPPFTELARAHPAGW